MKKRFSAFALAALLVATLLPTMSFAAEPIDTAAELKAAIEGATADTTITLAGNITDHVAVTAPNLDITITIDGNGKTLEGGIKFGIYNGSLDTAQSEIKFEDVTFKNKGIVVFNQAKVTVNECKFQNIAGTAAIHVWYQKGADDFVTITNNEISGVTGTEMPGINLNAVQTVTITNNKISNTSGNAIQITGDTNYVSGSSGTVTVTGNELNSWGLGGAGYAFRTNLVTYTTPSVTFTGNDMVKSTDPGASIEQYAKLTKLASGTADLNGNYWDGKTTLTSAEVFVGTGSTDDKGTETITNTTVSATEVVVTPAPVYGGPVMNWVKVNTAENGVVKSGPLAASAGATITLYPKAASGYVLDTVEVLDAEGNAVTLDGMKFQVPLGGVTVNATFKLAE